MPKRRILSRRNAWLLWGTGLCWFLAIALYPVSLRLTRAAGAGLAVALLAGFLALQWHRRWLRWSLLALTALAAIFTALPGRTTYDRPALRREIARAGARYEGTRYFWGGENRLGIDCSGLVRRAAIEGTFLHGLRTVNPWLVRRAVLLWWNDTSASEMEQGASGAARPVAIAPTLRLWDDKNLHPGDFAITRGGVHTLLYLGEHTWLEADPERRTVLRLRTGRDRSPWFEMPATVLRWRYLEMASQR